MLSVEDYYFYSYYDTSKSTIGSHITQLLISISFMGDLSSLSSKRNKVLQLLQSACRL